MKPITVLHAGPFGLAVARRLEALSPAPLRLAALVDDADALRSLIDGAGGVAVAVWRPHVATCERIDDLCHAAGVPWSLAEVHGQRLSCGPVVQPGAGPCYHCYRKRWASHHPAPEREMVLERAYQRDPALGPQGYVGPLVQIAAAALLDDLDAPAEHAGRLRLVDVLTGAVLETAVLGVHACKRCGLPQPMPIGSRFVRHLHPALPASLQ